MRGSTDTKLLWDLVTGLLWKWLEVKSFRRGIDLVARLESAHLEVGLRIELQCILLLLTKKVTNKVSQTNCSGSVRSYKHIYNNSHLRKRLMPTLAAIVHLKYQASIELQHQPVAF